MLVSRSALPIPTIPGAVIKLAVCFECGHLLLITKGKKAARRIPIIRFDAAWDSAQLQ